MISMKLHGFAEMRAIIQNAPAEVIEAADVEFARGARMVRDDMKNSIETGARSGRMYGDHQASAPGEPPANLTGALVASIDDVRNGTLSYSVHAAADHARPLELGTHKMAARPFMVPALERNTGAIYRNVKAACARALEKLKRKGKKK